MNTIAIAPEVHDFLEVVRAQLADLEPDDQRDILDGLEADLTDLVAERGGEALGDPVAYARELRAAAGLEPEMAHQATSGVSRRSVGVAVGGLLDAARQGADAVLEKVPGDVPAVLTWLRPLWWITRGWAAVQLIDILGGRRRMDVVPELGGFGWPLFLVAVAGSVAVGRGAFWPGGKRRGALARVALLALNIVAIAVTPVAGGHVVDSINQRYDRGWEIGYQNGARAIRDADPGTDKAGLYVDGKWVSNIYPYDAKGRPLVGVQLFNQIGQPINVVTQPEYVDDIGNANEGRPRIYYPWTNGAAQLLNVFPIPSRVQDSEEPSATAFSEAVRPMITAYPFASVPGSPCRASRPAGSR